MSDEQGRSGKHPVGERYRTLRALVADHLREKIVTGALEPMTRLVEGALAEELGVSRIPVREALKQLEAEGFVEIVARKGAVVAAISREEAEDFYEVRSALESRAARLAALRRSEEDVIRLRKIVIEGRDALARSAWDELTRLNSAFHEAIAGATGNAHLVMLMAGYGQKLTWIFASSAERRGKDAWDEHEGIFGAIADGDADLAEVLASRHIERSFHVFEATGAQGKRPPQPWEPKLLPGQGP